MSPLAYIVLSVIIVITAYLLGAFAKHRGFFFWRTFLMSILCLGGIAVLFMNAIGIKL